MAVLKALGNVPEAHAAQLETPVACITGSSPNRGALARGLKHLAELGFCHRYAGASSPHGGPARVMYSISEAGRAYLSGAISFLHAGTSRVTPLLQAFLADPPSGSAAARARDHGVDLAYLRRALLQTPQERYGEAVAAINALLALSK